MFLVRSKMRLLEGWMQMHGLSTYHNSRKARIQTAHSLVAPRKSSRTDFSHAHYQPGAGE
jgi:hypothetical protein